MASAAGSRQCGPEGAGRGNEEVEVEVEVEGEGEEEVDGEFDKFDSSNSPRLVRSASGLLFAFRSGAGGETEAFSLALVPFRARMICIGIREGRIEELWLDDDDAGDDDNVGCRIGSTLLKGNVKRRNIDGRVEETRRTRLVLAKQRNS